MAQFDERFPPNIFDRGIPSSLLKDMTTMLVNLDIFDSNKSVREFVAECPNLSPWKNSIPEATSPVDRVRLLISHLFRQKHITEGNALRIFLLYVSEKKGVDFTNLNLPNEK